jgi:multidrug efflux pump
MSFTDIFIRRPVLSMVISALILLFGLRAMMEIPIRQFPKMENAEIIVTTSYSGADAALIEGFVTTPLETAIAGAEGIEYMTSSSTMNTSTITCHIKLNFDPQKAFTDIMSKVSSATNQLPSAVEPPVIVKQSDDSTALMYISLDSSDLTPQQMTDYATRVIKPQLETVNGVASVNIFGGQTYAMRIFLNPVRMGALGITPTDVSVALAANNYLTTAGSTKGAYVTVGMKADTDLHDVAEFKKLIVKSYGDRHGTSIVRLSDIANIELGAESYNSSVTFNGKKAIFLAITPLPTANPLDVIAEVRATYPDVQKNFPPGLTSKIVYDATDYIRASIHEVVHTLGEAALIVVIVIFLFLGSIRSVLIPVVTIPLSLIGVFSLILVLGYSINLLTLLAMVLAIGLVVDDAIVVVENVFRHIEEGFKPFDAAILGAREIAMPVVSMTITLAAVYAPIGFLGGVTGALFREFAFMLACAVIVSGIIALTLSPMMASKILTQDIAHHRFVHYLDTFFGKLKLRYKAMLNGVLKKRSMVVVFVATVLVSLVFLYTHTPRETAPQEDTGFFMVFASGPQSATLNYTEKYSTKFNKIFNGFPETRDYFVVNGINGVNSAFGGMILKPWDQRRTVAGDLTGPFQGQLSQIAGLQTYAMQPPALPGGEGGMQFIIQTTGDYQTLFELSQKLLAKIQSSGLFIYSDNGLKFDNPQATLQINRSKAADLGLNMKAIGDSLSSALSGGYINYFNLMGRSYEVIPQLDRRFRLNPEQLEQIFLKTSNGIMVPLSTVATLQLKTEPNQLTHFQQMKSATLQLAMMPGHTVGEGVKYLQTTADELFPKGFSYDYAGEARQFVHEGNALVMIFFFSLIVIFLVLAAQFESFRDPLIILISVPLSICGALIPLNLGAATINIYTQIGLITLIGLITKHGILMTDFANHLQKNKNLPPVEAIIEAAAIRLRPILMTTAAMIFGVVPLIFASGAGSVSRFDIGLVIASGMLIGTCFTLFVVPTMYTFFAKVHTHRLEEAA